LINITVNEKPQTIGDGASVASLLRELKINSPAIAVEVNQTLVTQDKFGITLLSDGDSIEVVTLVGGG
jgi:sulfur carrier protein